MTLQIKDQDSIKEIQVLLTEIKEKLNVLPEVISDEVSSSIVGQSYYTYDTSHTYFPTLTLLYKETKVNKYPRIAQVKARLGFDNKSINDDVIKDLRMACDTCKEFTYRYGKVRGNYVSPNKRWKTTVFTYNKEEAIRLLTMLSGLVNEEFVVKNVSWTEGRDRTNPFKRENSLDDVSPNPEPANNGPVMAFHKAVLLVNGLSRPILLARGSYLD